MAIPIGSMRRRRPARALIRHAVDGDGRLLHRLTLTRSGGRGVSERSGQERDRPQPRECRREADRPRLASRQMERPAADRAGEPRAGMSAHNPHDGSIVLTDPLARSWAEQQVILGIG